MSLGESIKNRIISVINNPNYRTKVIIKNVSREGATYGGYEKTKEVETSSEEVYAIPSSYLPITKEFGRSYGTTQEGEMRIIFKPTENINSSSVIEFQGEEWTVKDIKELFFNGVRVAYSVLLGKRY